VPAIVRLSVLLAALLTLPVAVMRSADHSAGGQQRFPGTAVQHVP
jgi:hypothetical protein